MSESSVALGFGCVQACRPEHGHTYFSHVEDAADAILRTETGRKLREKGVCYIRCLTDAEAYEDTAAQTASLESGGSGTTGVYNHWQTSFGTNSQKEAEAAAQAKQLHVEWEERV